MAREVKLTGRMERFIAERVAAGDYADADEAIRAALRLLEREHRLYERKLARLKAAVQLGYDQIDRGEYRDIAEGEIEAWIEELGREATSPPRRSETAA
jgi:antitoxin ParD1/3/4